MSRPLTDSAVMADLVGAVSELDHMMDELRVKYQDAPTVVIAEDVKSMLSALSKLSMDLFRGRLRAGTKQEQYDNYCACANDHRSLSLAALRVESAT